VESFITDRIEMHRLRRVEDVRGLRSARQVQGVDIIHHEGCPSNCGVCHLLPALCIQDQYEKHRHANQAETDHDGRKSCGTNDYGCEFCRGHLARRTCIHMIEDPPPRAAGPHYKVAEVVAEECVGGAGSEHEIV